MNALEGPRELHLSLYESMLRIRKVEEKIVELYPQQEMRCPTHLSIGQEAVSAGVCAALRADDIVYASHRCHGPYIARGGDIGRMLAELYGKQAGCARGKGGSMHLSAPEVGMLGASSIVGGSTPIALGSALAFKMRGKDRVAVSFFGDGAVEEGVFHESLNFAALHKLAVLFVCENNLYATHSHISARQAQDNIYQRASIYGIPGFRIDGNDVLAVYECARQGVDRARQGEGPSLIECRTYRWREHVGPNYDYDLGYRSRQEVETWMHHCPAQTYETALLDAGILTREQLGAVGNRLEEEIDRAASFARASPFPQAEELFLNLY